MDDKIITFETYHDPMLAHIIRAKLEAHDIPCFIEDDHMSGLNPVYNHAISDIKLKIFERDLNECLRIIDDDNEILLTGRRPGDRPGNRNSYCLPVLRINTCNPHRAQYRTAELVKYLVFVFCIHFTFLFI